MWDAALGTFALLAGGFLLYRAVQSVGAASASLIQWFLVISMITIAAVVVLRIGVGPIVATPCPPCSCPSSSAKPASPSSSSSPLAVHAGHAIRTGLEQVTGWLTSWINAPGPALTNAHSPSSASSDPEREL